MNMRSRPVINSEYIYDDLLKKIIDLEYKPGEGISENELCEKYGTTRHTIRGALSVLKEKGLIEVIPQKGTYVSLIDLKLIDDIVFLRSAVEQETIHRIFKFIDRTELVKSLKKCLERQTDLEPSDANAPQFYKLDDEFHGILMDAAGCGSVQDLYDDAYLHFRRWRNMEVGLRERISNLPKEHEDIIKAIESGTEHDARKALGDHIVTVDQFGEEMKSKYPQYFI